MLGLPEADFGVDGGVFYTAGAGTMFRAYERPPSTAEHTVVVFLVELEQEMAELRDRGVSFEGYDLPGLKTENGIYSDEQSGFKGSWVKDPDGNIVGLTQILHA